jgi:hypothetical protein
VNSFRSQLRAPADTLMQAIRQLLEVSLEDDSKKLVEKVLENALLLQTSLQDEALVAQATRPEAADAKAA